MDIRADPCRWGDGASLTVRDIGLRRLPADFFANCSQAEYIDLEHNGLEGIAAGAFRGLWNVQRLDLSDNALTSVDNDMWGEDWGLSNSLYTLDLSNNSITSLATVSSESPFLNLENLRVLSIASNPLGSVKRENFEGLTQLGALHLSNTSLQHVSQYTCCGSVNVSTGNQGFGFMLTDLYLDYNELVDASVLNCTCRVCEWEAKVLYENNVQHLNLAYNKLTEAPILPMCRKNNMDNDGRCLSHLNLTGNQIALLPRDTLGDDYRKLEQLYLGDNVLEAIDSHAFDLCHSLKILSLEANKLTNLSANTFAQNSVLTTLYLQG